MSYHPTGITIEIVGTESSTQGRSCDEHCTCGSVLEEGKVVRIRCVQIVKDGKEEAALAVYHVWDGIDSCRVGFLKHHLLKHWKRYDGVLAQIIDVYSKESESNSRRQFYHNKGCCVAAIISSLSVFDYLNTTNTNNFSFLQNRTTCAVFVTRPTLGTRFCPDYFNRNACGMITHSEAIFLFLRHTVYIKIMFCQRTNKTTTI
jgi:hypothetical protein